MDILILVSWMTFPFLDLVMKGNLEFFWKIGNKPDRTRRMSSLPPPFLKNVEPVSQSIKAKMYVTTHDINFYQPVGNMTE